jgi:4-amino-4-deoxy-L-arabinose transferase-like glycosyltransferase
MFSSIGCALSTIRFFEYAIMIPSDATLARRALLGTYALHFEASANRTGSGTACWLRLGLTSIGRGASAIILPATFVTIVLIVEHPSRGWALARTRE